MKAKYDEEVDVLLIQLKRAKPDHGEDIGDGIIVHYNKKNIPVEIEILNAKFRLIEWIKQALKVEKSMPRPSGRGP